VSSHRNPVGRFADATARAAGKARDTIADGVREGVREVRRDVRREMRRAKGAKTGPRTGARRTVLGTIRQIPDYLRLLGGLLVDKRVSILDKLLVVAAIAYILAPIDLVPDFIPFFGEVDDVFLLVTALQRLISNTGRRVLLDHWGGDPRDLRDLSLHRIMQASAFFLPLAIQQRLRGMTRRP
jgi:uncharacterized membrane protein YkvA (DUF1232 family)